MAEAVPQASRRLDSWKEIAAYLGRDARTAMRWATDQGLPVRRVAGGKGRSVFAFTAEVDVWLMGRTSPAPAESASGEKSEPVELAAPRDRRRWLVTTGAIAFALALIGVVKSGGAGAAGFTVSIDAHGVRLNAANGSVKTIHEFDPQAGVVVASRDDQVQSVTDLDADGEIDILAGIQTQQGVADQTIRSGRLLRLTPSGTVRWTLTFDDTVQFGGTTYTGPWSLTDWRPSPDSGRKRIAAVTHHQTWWPSIVSLLDDGGSHLGSFVNAGWIEQVLWIDPNRLAVGGFNNPLDGGMFAVLDARNLRGRSPDAPSPYTCESCPEGDPLWYFVLPRSELNVLSGSPFNRARVDIMHDRIVAQTAEMADGTGAAAIYEFDRDLRFTTARYSDRYWEAHRRLELQGVVMHTREACPYRAGPAAIRSWSRAEGWKSVLPRSRTP